MKSDRMGKNRKGGAGMADTKLFHPTIEGSNLCVPESETVDFACVLLHTIGWFTQQGAEENAIDFLRKIICQDRQAVVKVCAAGLAVLLDGNPGRD